MVKKGTKRIIVITLVLIEIVSIFFAYKSGIDKVKREEIKNKKEIYAIMIETGMNTNKYIDYDSQKWPGEGYIINRELTECVDEVGNEIEGILEFDNETKIATVRSKRETYCYLYFDYDPAPKAFDMSIKGKVEEEGKKYTNEKTNELTLTWEEDDIEYYCLTEDKDYKNCSWLPVDKKDRSQKGKYTFINIKNEEKEIGGYLKDGGGSVSPRKEVKITYDDKGPIVEMEAEGKKGNEEWYTSLKERITGNDTIEGIKGVGVGSIKYCITKEKECTPDKTINGESGEVEIETNNSNEAQKICSYGIDKLGNSGIKSCTVASYKVDEEKPTIKFIIGTNTKGENNWYKALKIRIEGKDVGSGIASIKYCVGKECSPKTTVNNNDEVPIQIGEKQQVCAEIKDKAGNSAKNCSEYYNVDGVSPTVEFDVGTNTKGSNNWYKALKIEVNEEDTTSGVDKVYWCKTSTSKTEATCTPTNEVSRIGEVQMSENSVGQKVCVKVKDKAGNTSEVKCSEAYKVDGTKPTNLQMNFVDGEFNKYTSGTWANRNLYAARSKDNGYTPTATETISGIDHYEISSDGKSWTKYSYNKDNELYRMNTSGTHKRYFRAIDKAGNVSDTLIVTGQIDLAKPTITFTPDREANANGWYKELYVTLKAEDTLSGINTKMKYCTTGKDSSCEPATEIGSSGTAKAHLTTKPKICIEASDKAGNVQTTCKTYNVDGVSPTCNVEKNPSAAGVNGTVKCSDADSKCVEESIKIKNLTETTSYEVQDLAGNTATCEVKVSVSGPHDDNNTRQMIDGYGGCYGGPPDGYYSGGWRYYYDCTMDLQSSGCDLCALFRVRQYYWYS